MDDRQLCESEIIGKNDEEIRLCGKLVLHNISPKKLNKTS